MLLGKFGEIFHRLQRNLKLCEKESCVFQNGRHFFQQSRGELAIGARHDHDVVLAALPGVIRATPDAPSTVFT
jgi:hypothetical protein